MSFWRENPSWQQLPCPGRAAIRRSRRVVLFASLALFLPSIAVGAPCDDARRACIAAARSETIACRSECAGISTRSRRVACHASCGESRRTERKMCRSVGNACDVTCGITRPDQRTCARDIRTCRSAVRADYRVCRVGCSKVSQSAERNRCVRGCRLGRAEGERSCGFQGAEALPGPAPPEAALPGAALPGAALPGAVLPQGPSPPRHTW